VFENKPIHFAAPYHSPIVAWGAKAAVILAMVMAVLIRARTDRASEPYALATTAAFVFLAGLMTCWHWLRVDSARVLLARGGFYSQEDWQREVYLKVLSRDAGKPDAGLVAIPHVFRPLPYGFTRSLELATGDWWFACLSYRWFFDFWFLWAYFRFVRLFQPPGRSWLALAPFAVLYPLSIQFYQGQLTDPLSHALFALALIYVVENLWVLLAATLALGVLAKETVAIVVVGYFACFARQGARTLFRTVLLASACLAAYFLARLPVGWGLDFRSINGTDGLMISSNLCIGNPPYRLVRAMETQNWLQPLLFIGIFIPFLLFRWRHTDFRLRALLLTVPPLVFISNLSFGWLYESRNYVPLLPLLGAAAVGPTAKSWPAEDDKAQRIHQPRAPARG
jgi:hypothetical protein